MAKSLRSKWKRKMRAVKRVRYGEKENKVLEKILKNSDERKKLLENVTETCKMLRCNIGNCTLKHGPQPLGELTNVWPFIHYKYIELNVYLPISIVVSFT